MHEPENAQQKSKIVKVTGTNNRLSRYRNTPERFDGSGFGPASETKPLFKLAQFVA
jgi:hypothetical protein